MGKRERQGGFARFVRFALMLCLAFLAGGFFVFAYHVDSLHTPSSLPEADGIVVWTGRGGGRLETAGALLKDGRGERLLISGVNEKTDIEALTPLLGLDVEMAECCVDLDYAALDTRGNARETAAWARVMGYDHILLVTSDYHMPRARIEIEYEIGRILITPVPVESANRQAWWRDGSQIRRLLGEYGKYLLSLSRGRRDEKTTPVAPQLESGL